MISDFLMDLDDIKETLPLLARHDVNIIQVLDPVEKELKFNGDFQLKDSETGKQLRTYISKRMQDRYQCHCQWCACLRAGR